MRRIAQLLALALLLSAAPASLFAGTTTVHKDKHGKTKTVVHKNKRGKTVVHQGKHGKVVVHTGFPIRRTLPLVVVRPPRVAIRVAPRVFVAPIVFRPVVVVRPAPTLVVWSQAESFVPADEWTDVALTVGHPGTHLYFEVAGGPARVSFAEVVYADGETQVVDFADQSYSPGYYPVVTLERPRPVDHVRFVAFAGAPSVNLSFHLTN